MAITDFLAKNFFPEGNLQQIKAQSLSPREYNIRATEDQIQNMFGGRGGILKDIIAPAATFGLSLPYDTGQGIVRAFNKFQPDTGILDYDAIPSGPTFKDIGASIAAERPLSSAYERMIGASSGLANRFQDLSGIFNTSAMASDLAPTNISLNNQPSTMMFDRITDPNLMRAETFRAIENQPFEEIPGFNFIDAPTSLMSRLQNREFLNNPAVLNPLEKIGSQVTSVTDKVKSGFGKGIDLGKAAIGGIASLATGIPGIGLLLNAFGPMTEEEKAMRDFYGSEFGLDDIGRVQSGIMKGYNPVSMFGGPGLSKSIDKRISRIQKTLKKKKSDTLQKRLQELKALRQKEEQARERDRAARARAANAAVYANLDRRTGGKGFGDAGGFSTARAGKEGAFGTFDGSRGRKDFFKGGLVGLL